MDTGDKTFTQDQIKPEIVACIMHPTKQSFRTYTADPTPDFSGVIYGLCRDCVKRTMAMPKGVLFKAQVDLTIKRRLEVLARRENGKRNTEENKTESSEKEVSQEAQATDQGTEEKQKGPTV